MVRVRVSSWENVSSNPHKDGSTMLDVCVCVFACVYLSGIGPAVVSLSQRVRVETEETSACSSGSVCLTHTHAHTRACAHTHTHILHFSIFSKSKKEKLLLIG